jgi:aryl-alcohol dehydrogenase-like predicted oxidoreductase
MELALGTAQFGLPYGVAGRSSPVPEQEVRTILEHAAQLGIRMLDTAAAYGDIEARLAELAPNRAFKIVTKLSAMPTGMSAGEAEAWADSTLRRAGERIGDSLYAVLVHRAEDLLEGFAESVWARCVAWASGRKIKLGVSCYDPGTLNRAGERFPIEIAQLPGNALDQRLFTNPVIHRQKIEIHVRSAFLQGLLLMPAEEAKRRVPQAAKALRRWHMWLREQSIEPLAGALGLVKGFPGVSHCVVGVDSLAQLEAIAAAWQVAPALRDDTLAALELDVIDPRRWPRLQ